MQNIVYTNLIVSIKFSFHCFSGSLSYYSDSFTTMCKVVAGFTTLSLGMCKAVYACMCLQLLLSGSNSQNVQIHKMCVYGNSKSTSL